MIRACLCLLLIGCAETAEPPPPTPVAPRVATPVVTPPPELPQIIDLSNDVVIVQIDCDDPAVHCGADDDPDEGFVPDDLPDTQDRCPDVAEDLDGFQDIDGCPDPAPAA